MRKNLFLSFISLIILLIQSSGTLAEEKSRSISLQDHTFLNKVERDTFQYFLKERNPKTGLIKDSSRYGAPCSIAGMGFALSAICIADHRKWLNRNEAYRMVIKILKIFLRKVETKKGFYYHFVDVETGKRVWESELSSIDTAIFLAGALLAAEYFNTREIRVLSQRLYQRVDWAWMQNKSDFICMGWKPEQGFLPYYWDAYSEHMLLYALAIGASDNSVPLSSWYRWKRPKGEYKGVSYVYCGTGSLFVYQYSHAWINFKKIADKGVNWWDNSVKATKVNRQYCLDLSQKFKTFSSNCWGVTASLGPNGYKGYGTQVGYYPFSDGTVNPSAVAGSIPFLPKECIDALKYMYHNYKNKLYWKYGFKDAFNLDKNWFSNESLAIDQGITILMIENFRSGLIWKYFMKLPCIKKWKNLVEGRIER
ncbi:glucoamylase family protein [Candidatus Auribacterota bacterium]